MLGHRGPLAIGQGRLEQVEESGHVLGGAGGAAVIGVEQAVGLAQLLQLRPAPVVLERFDEVAHVGDGLPLLEREVER